jgi:hypothetical protein
MAALEKVFDDAKLIPFVAEVLEKENNDPVAVTLEVTNKLVMV